MTPADSIAVALDHLREWNNSPARAVVEVCIDRMAQDAIEGRKK